MTTMPMLDDPVGMRERDGQFWNGRIGEYVLKGRTVYVSWLPCSQTHTHIVVWDDRQMLAMVNNIVRVRAAQVTEGLLSGLEAA